MPFNGINNLRDHNESIAMEPWQIDEIRKCANDVIYFIRHYIYINTKDEGMQLFNLRDYQEGIIENFLKYRYNIAKWPRQVGKSVTTMAYLLWYGMFHKDKTIVILANKLRLAQEQLQHLRDAYIHLPYWMQPGVRKWNIQSIQFSHGTRINCYATSPDTVRGMAINCVAGNSLITVRDKQTGEIKEMSMKELHDDLNEEKNILDIRIFDLKDE